MRMFLAAMMCFAGAQFVAIAHAAESSTAVTVDSKIAPYAKSGDAVTGKVMCVGSDSMVNLINLFGDGFKASYPNALVEVDGKGSGTAPPALSAGTATFGPMSRPMNEKEISEFEGKFGYKPTGIPVAVDTLAVFVHKDNPIAAKGLSLQQIDAMFSKSRKGGSEKEIVTWGDAGLDGEWKDKPISLYGRNSASGTYAYFKEHALYKGDFKASVKEQPGTSGVVLGVAGDKYGIGYGGIGYLTADVKAVPLDPKAGTKYVAPSATTAYDGTYPMSRFLLMYVNYKSDTKLDPLRREFIKYMVSQQGQKDVIKDGYLPIPSAVADKSLKAVGIDAAK